jgi:hypothetical protein
MTSHGDPTADAELAALITQQLTAILPTLVTQLIQANTSTNQGNNTPHCNSCHPPRLSSSKGVTEIPTTSKSNNRKRKATNFAITAPAAPTNQVALSDQRTQKTYAGNYPRCITCQYHHPQKFPCRQCTNCGRFGHLQPSCRSQPQTNQPRNTNTSTNTNPNPKACYECGDPSHFRNQCPKLIIVNQGSRGRASTTIKQEASTSDDVTNGTFLVDTHYTFIYHLIRVPVNALYNT